MQGWQVRVHRAHIKLSSLLLLSLQAFCRSRTSRTNTQQQKLAPSANRVTCSGCSSNQSLLTFWLQACHLLEQYHITYAFALLMLFLKLLLQWLGLDCSQPMQAFHSELTWSQSESEFYLANYVSWPKHMPTKEQKRKGR